MFAALALLLEMIRQMRRGTLAEQLATRPPDLGAMEMPLDVWLFDRDNR